MNQTTATACHKPCSQESKPLSHPGYQKPLYISIALMICISNLLCLLLELSTNRLNVTIGSGCSCAYRQRWLGLSEGRPCDCTITWSCSTGRAANSGSLSVSVVQLIKVTSYATEPFLDRISNGPRYLSSSQHTFTNNTQMFMTPSLSSNLIHRLLCIQQRVTCAFHSSTHPPNRRVGSRQRGDNTHMRKGFWDGHHGSGRTVF